MNGRTLIISAVLDLAILMVIAFVCGCEVDSASQKVEIRPSSTTLKYGQSVTLTAYNGYNYTWSLQNEAWGILNTRQGIMVTYTSLYDPPGAPAVQIVTVSSTFVDDSTSGSSTSPAPQTASAYITHIPATSLVETVSATP